MFKGDKKVIVSNIKLFIDYRYYSRHKKAWISYFSVFTIWPKHGFTQSFYFRRSPNRHKCKLHNS